MSEQSKSVPQYEVTLDEIARLVLASKGVSSGLWHLGARFQFAAIQAGDSESAMRPAGVVALRSIGLTPAQKPGPLVFDAEELAKTGRGKKTTRAAKKPKAAIE